MAKHNAPIEKRIAPLTKSLQKTRDKYWRLFLDDALKKVSDASIRAKLKRALLLDEKKRTPAQAALIEKHIPKLKVDEKIVEMKYPAYKKERARLKGLIAKQESRLKKPVFMRGLLDLAGKPPQGRLLVRGDYRNPGQTVAPNVPAVLTPADFKFAVKPLYKSTGRRLAFAKWLTRADHPLTARVRVNRIWMHYFGRGIVNTPADFGKMGARPTHPRLLDWLATRLVADGWRQKRLHRLILISTAYRQSSSPNAKMTAIDPENKLLGSWRPRRLEGEAIRDAILAVAGKLNRKMFGKPVLDKQHKDGRVTVADTPEGNRGSVYLIAPPQRADDVFESVRRSAVGSELRAAFAFARGHTVADVVAQRIQRSEREGVGEPPCGWKIGRRQDAGRPAVSTVVFAAGDRQATRAGRAFSA